MFFKRSLSGLGIALACALTLCVSASARVPDGYRGVKLGMPKSEVVHILETGSDHSSYHRLGPNIGEVIRGDELFRFATYRFDDKEVLVEIGLHMREIVGRDKVLELFKQKHGLNVSGAGNNIVEDDRLLEVKGNRLILKRAAAGGSRAAKTSPR